MKIFATHELTPKLEGEIRGLEAICTSYDESAEPLFLENGLNRYKDMNCYYFGYEQDELVGFLFAFSPGGDETEISGITRPDQRRKGLFKTLVKELVKEAVKFGYRDLLFVVHRGCAEGEAAARAMDAKVVLSHSEFQMQYEVLEKQEGVPSEKSPLRLLSAEQPDVEALASLSSRAFGMSYEDSVQMIQNKLGDQKRRVYKLVLDSDRGQCQEVVGSGSVKIEGERARLYGIAIHPDYRGRHFGRFLLENLIENVNQEATEIWLDVDSVNDVAYQLYATGGFVIRSACDYYRIGCDVMDTQL